MSIEEYQQKFFDLLPYFSHITENYLAKYDHFLQGLNPEIHQMVAFRSDMTYEGASHLFISARFSKRYRLSFVPLDVLLVGHQLSANMMVIAIDDYDRIIGIDLLTTYRAIVDCYQRFVQFRPEDGEAWYFYGEGARPPTPVIYALKARHTLESGGEGYLIYVINASLEVPDIQKTLVVREFLDVFPEEIPGLPQVREIEFDIELMPVTAPISRAPYRLAPTEMRELQKQLQDLLDKGYIRPSV
ncbi:uncharacterized protein [Henckelia pumila]|uniref:uncharacterized protein n=1 Tax=Henckelia pumila TaxID=405737 RepID=UPI003C6E046A